MSLPVRTRTQDRIQLITTFLQGINATYSYQTPPNNNDETLESQAESTLRRCLVENHNRLNNLENHISNKPISSPPGNSSQGSYSTVLDTLEAHRGEISEQYTELENRFDNLERGVHDIGDQIGTINGKFEDVESDFINHVDEIDVKLSTAVSKLDDKLQVIEGDIKKDIYELRMEIELFGFYQRREAARTQNYALRRLYETVQHVPVRYAKPDGNIIFMYHDTATELSSWKRKKVGFYWDLHSERNHGELISLHQRYQIPLDRWAYDDETDADSDDLDPRPDPPSSLEEAVQRYRQKAVFALFEELGLNYARFKSQFKRATEITSKVKMKRQPDYDDLVGSARKQRQVQDDSTTEPIDSTDSMMSHDSS
ncbi:hypothetical protein F5884DRAFT_812155 [Xylogone sp. PMI_703]|nr:hypothetical protein F5884DRAFT_812155 [Xylogone sp. PMI_703]